MHYSRLLLIGAVSLLVGCYAQESTSPLSASPEPLQVSGDPSIKPEDEVAERDYSENSGYWVETKEQKHRNQAPLTRQRLLPDASTDTPDSEYRRGLDYQYGDGVPMNTLLAAHWIEVAAKGGNLKAQINLAERYAKGDGVTHSLAEAEVWFRKAAEQGNAHAQQRLGDILICEDKSLQSLPWFLKSAQQGDAVAAYFLSGIYANGLDGAPRSYTEAGRWLRQSAEEGYTDAQCLLGLYYMSGTLEVGGKKDLIQAKKWLTLAASHGDEFARDTLNERFN